MRDAIGVLLIVGLLLGGHVVPGEAQPTTADLAWQAVGTTAGMAVGSMAGTLASLPGVILSLPDWITHPDRPGKTCFPDMSRGDVSEEDGIVMGLCFFQMAVPMMSFTAGSTAGGSLGGLIGLLTVADAQGQDGSLIGAGLGLLAGQAAAMAIVESRLRGDLDRIIQGIQAGEEDWEAYLDTSYVGDVVGPMLVSMMIPLAAVAGYNLL